MAGGASREIKRKIQSIQNTRKITKAMEMVAASKMRRCQERMMASRPYARRILRIIQHVAYANVQFRHPYLEKREGKRYGLLVVTTDRGLCGGLNANLFRALIRRMKRWDEEGVTFKLGVIGQKGVNFFKSINAPVVAYKTQLGDYPHLEDIVGVTKAMLDLYGRGELDRLYLVFNEFISTMSQRPVIQQLLPIELEEESPFSHEIEKMISEGYEWLKGYWDYLYEPDAESVLSELLVRYQEALVYQALVENKACEQAARMIAMKNASDNAGKLIDELQLLYNKARQAAITTEISEIVSGAAAVQ